MAAPGSVPAGGGARAALGADGGARAALGADGGARAALGAGGGAPAEDVVVFTFGTIDDARRALTTLRRLHEARHIRLSAGAVVGRRANGRAFAVEQGRHPAGAAKAGVTELLSGPFGVVLECAPDALVGSLVDIADLEKSDRMLRCFGGVLPPGGAGAIAVVTECRPGTIISAATRFDAAVSRVPRHEVEAAMRAASGPATRARRIWSRRSSRR